jgi:hypothetical protein
VSWIRRPSKTTGLLQQLIREELEIDHSRPNCLRLMKEAAWSYRTLRKSAAEPIPTTGVDFGDFFSGMF